LASRRADLRRPWQDRPIVAATPPPFTVPAVQATFRAQTGFRLFRVASATTSQLTTLGTRPMVTKRFGSFELYVIRPPFARSTIRALVGRDRPDARGIYWEPDQNVGVTAISLFAPNLVVNWFPPGGKHRVNASWARLNAAVRRLR
jgi:hypothetical protein